MDPPEHRSPKRELQGPRPTPLKVRKDSHRIRKPPVVPHEQQAPARPPVIIYTVSPKVIHANPSEFMSLVQRLTGQNSSSSSSSSVIVPFQENRNMGAISLATIEKTRTPQGKKSQIITCDQNMEMVDEGIEINRGIETSGLFPQGILSPNPASLPPIPSNFFSPPSAGFFHDMSPLLQHTSNRNCFELCNYFPSPSYFVSPRIILSPGTPYSFDRFSNLFDHYREK
ncbi:hypothetical protein HAX54_050986 [Datura stramonium]|uniref:VQ domain-containing protein n=1 Tax=Datura stramonium TaxID=4076 RepID=A0ABS8WPL7_DATST|nr:hypothetical protein [Datura stramonium]